MEQESRKGIQSNGHIKFELRKQGGFIFGLLLIFYGYFGIICNMIMYNELGFPIQYTEWENKSVLIYTYETYPKTFFLPVLLLFGLCFLLTYREDIPHYGIKQSLWFVPIIIAFSFIWYWVVSGLSAEPFRLLFTNPKGYLNIFIIFVINLSGALCGMKLKQFILSKRK